MLENLKKDVCEIAKRAQRDGLCKHKSGNFSARDVKSGYIVITPTSVDRELLTPRDMIMMDLEANVIENLSGLKPTSESLMHITIYKTRKDANAIAHTHSMYATTFALLNKPIPAIVYEVANMGLTKGRVPVAPYGRPGTMELANSVVDACMEADIFVLEDFDITHIRWRHDEALSTINVYQLHELLVFIENVKYQFLLRNQRIPTYKDMREGFRQELHIVDGNCLEIK